MRGLLIASIILLSVNCFAQSLVSARISSGVDIGLGIKKQQLAPSIAYYQLLNVGEKRLFSFGYTVKLGTFYARNLDYITAPARLTRGKGGLGSLGASLVPANIDTVSFTNVSMTNLNLGLRVQVQVGPVQLGASADILGGGFGKRRTGRYQSSTGTFTTQSIDDRDSVATFQGANANQSASPANLNLRLLGDNNIGTLSSELFARIIVNQRIGIKVGYQWLTTAVSVRNRDTQANNNRFRNRTDFPYVAVTFPVF